MKKILILLVTTICLAGCDKEKKYLSGNPSEVLPIDVYNTLQKEYKTIKRFQKGTAVVKREKYGLINEFGDEIIPCEYDTIYRLKKCFRIIVKESLYGAVNVDGEIIIQCRHTDAIDEGRSYLALKSNDKWGIADSLGKDVTQYKYDEVFYLRDSVFVASYNGKWGVSNYQNDIIIPYEYDEILYKMENAITDVKSGEFYGLYNSKNQKVLDCKYGMIAPNSSGLVTVRIDAQNYRDVRKALIEAETGKIVIPFDYMDMGHYSEGLVSAQNTKGKWGYLDKNGKIIIPFIYEEAGDFHEGLAAVYKKSGEFMSTYGFGIVEKLKCGYIDKKGNVIIPFKFQQSFSVETHEFHDGLAVQGIGRKNLFAQIYGYIDKTGNWVVQPTYDEADAFKKGVAQVVVNEKYGYINTKGEQIIPCEYDKYGGWFVNDSTLELEKDGIKFYFNLRGEPVLNPDEY